VADRTCISCRTVGPAAGLIRLVNDSGAIAPAMPGAPGRGAWVCRREPCVSALNGGEVARALRLKPGDPAVAPLVLSVVQEGILRGLRHPPGPHS